MSNLIIFTVILFPFFGFLHIPLPKIVPHPFLGPLPYKQALFFQHIPLGQNYRLANV